MGIDVEVVLEVDDLFPETETRIGGVRSLGECWEGIED